MTVTSQRYGRLGHAAAAQALVINLVACLALIAQFLLGMVVNLFVTIPGHHPGANASNFFSGIAAAIVWVIPHGAPWLIAHVVLGLVLVIAGLINLVWAPRFGTKGYTAAAVLGALALLGAAFNGVSFLNYGHNFSSMIMAGLWALATSCYLICLYLAARRVLT
jgi:hypothetical protein